MSTNLLGDVSKFNKTENLFFLFVVQKYRKMILEFYKDVFEEVDKIQKGKSVLCSHEYSERLKTLMSLFHEEVMIVCGLLEKYLPKLYSENKIHSKLTGVSLERRLDIIQIIYKLKKDSEVGKLSF